MNVSEIIEKCEQLCVFYPMAAKDDATFNEVAEAILVGELKDCNVNLLNLPLWQVVALDELHRAATMGDNLKLYICATTRLDDPIYRVLGYYNPLEHF